MYAGQIGFSQIMSFLPLRAFHKCVARYKGEYKVQNFTCLDQCLCMAFAQLTYCESLRDIEVCLRGNWSKLYHWASVRVSPRARWQMPTSRATGASMPISLRFSSPEPERCTSTTTSASNWTTPSTRSMRPPSISACPCSPGRDFAQPKARSRCTRCSICAAAFPSSSIFQTEKWRM